MPNKVMKQIFVPITSDITIKRSTKRTLSDEEVADAERLFKSIDLDHSGTIDEFEFRRMFERMHIKMTDLEMSAMMSEIDMDGDGVVSFTEFLRAVALKKISDGGKDDHLIKSAFVQCGGNEDCTGEADGEKVKEILESFGIDVDVTALFGKSIIFEKFKAVFVK